MSKQRKILGRSLDRPIRRAAVALDETDRTATQSAQAVADHPLMQALAWFAELGDQPPLRTICGATILAGVVTGNQRLLRAGARMLVAHELATAAKDVVKSRVDRLRPPHATSRNQRKPKAGRHTEKAITSFPSGHSAGSIAVARAFSREYPEYATPAIATAGLIAAAQVPRCAHYPTDVGAGLLLGLATEAAAQPLWSRFVDNGPA